MFQNLGSDLVIRSSKSSPSTPMMSAAGPSVAGDEHSVVLSVVHVRAQRVFRLSKSDNLHRISFVVPG